MPLISGFRKIPFTYLVKTDKIKKRKLFSKNVKFQEKNFIYKVEKKVFFSHTNTRTKKGLGS